MIVVNYEATVMEHFLQKESEEEEGWRPCVALCPGDVLELFEFLNKSEAGRTLLKEVKTIEDFPSYGELNPEFYRNAGWIPS